MNAGKFLFMAATLAVLAGCSTMVDPTLTPEEHAVLDFNMSGVTIGGKPGQLALFPQVQHIPVKLGGYDVYEVTNPTPNVSGLKAWYFNDHLVRLELRYFNGGGVNTLARAGGWDGLRNYLFQKYGPPSHFGSDVPIVATTGKWNVKYAKFNGEWDFTRIKRQINYSAMSDGNGGIGVVTIMDTTPLLVPKMVADGPVATRQAVPNASRPPEEVAPRAANPGF